MAEYVQDRWEASRHVAALWAGILAGPVAWAVDLGISYSVTGHDCSTGHFYIQHIVTACTLVLALAGFFIARRELAAIPPPTAPNEEGGTPEDRSHFMAKLGMASSIAFAIVIIAMAVPRWLLTPCD